MEYALPIAGAIAGALFGWFAAGQQHRLYRQPEYREQPATGTRLLRLRLFLALSCALTAVFALRPGHYDTAPALLVLAFAWVLLVLSSTDFERRIIPNRLSYPAIAAALLFCWAWPDRSWDAVLLGGLLAGLAGVALFAIGLVFRGALGLGDVKLMLLIGLLAGWPATVPALFIGILVAGVPGIALTLTGRGRTYFSYGPYLALGALIVLLFPSRFV